MLYLFIQINTEKDYKMSRPQRSLRLQRRSSDSLNVLSGASGELFFDADLGALRLYTNNNNDRRTLADRSWVRDNTFDGNYNNLTNTPVIPTVDGLATETYVDDAIAAIPSVDLTGLATETYVDDAIATLPGVDLTGYATETYVNTTLTGALELYATEEYVDNVVANTVDAVIDSAPETLDTLNKLAAALGDDANFATTVTTALSDKQNTAYTPGTASDWNGTAPATIVEAIDRLAAVVKVLNGGLGA